VNFTHLQHAAVKDALVNHREWGVVPLICEMCKSDPHPFIIPKYGKIETSPLRVAVHPWLLHIEKKGRKKISFSYKRDTTYWAWALQSEVIKACHSRRIEQG
jgi:hypothetical protein